MVSHGAGVKALPALFWLGERVGSGKRANSTNQPRSTNSRQGREGS